ncbi:MAG: FecR domain-containing protein, partial [Vulcanimicrobiaceae bacterium]
MRARYVRYVLALVLILAPMASGGIPGAASGVKTLGNLRGDVAYQFASEKPLPLPVRTVIVLHNDAFAITGTKSLGVLTMPDSSRVLLGANTRVQLAYFTPGRVASAKFVLYDGKMRFSVEHYKGARANYIFQTPTSQIAVRGTVGDIGLLRNTLRVNVYKLSNPNLPVQVTFKNGRLFLLHAGQSLTASIVNGVITVTVMHLTAQALTTFSAFGNPANFAKVIQALSTGTTAVGTAGAAAAAAVGGAAVVNAVKGAG